MDSISSTPVKGGSGLHSVAGVLPSSIPYYGKAPPFGLCVNTRHLRISQRNGLRFQAKVEQELFQAKRRSLHTQYSYDEVLIGPWVYYTDSSNEERFCQPDLLLFARAAKKLVIIECKIRHTRYAEPQCRMYKRIMALMHPDYHICTIEVCKSIDPMEAPQTLVSTLAPHNHQNASYLWQE